MMPEHGSSALRAALETPRTPGKLIRIFQPEAGEEMWSCLHQEALCGERVLAWSSPQRALEILALGSCLDLTAQGSGRFAELNAAWEKERRQIEILSTGPLPSLSSIPALFSGFSFDSEGEHDRAWKGWPRALAWLPQLMLVRTASWSGCIFQLRWSSPEQALQQLDELQLLRERLSSPPLEQGVSASKNQLTRHGRDDKSWQAWRRRVERARGHMESGELQKVVLARREQLHTLTQVFDPWSTFLELRQRQQSCTCFALQLGSEQQGVFLGATPENLVEVHQGRLETMALAGTRQRGESRAGDHALGEALLSSSKDLFEQSLVSNSILDTLSPLTSSLHQEPEPQLASFADVQHLKTIIVGELGSEVTLLDVVDALHPTPAVGGLPRREALHWLREHEGLERGWYAAPLGWLSSEGDGCFVVTIRSALVHEQRAEAFAGCGLVSSSDPASEWEESIVKLQAVSQGLSLVESQAE